MAILVVLTSLHFPKNYKTLLFPTTLPTVQKQNLDVIGQKYMSGRRKYKKGKVHV